ncbi:hypothetical protein ERS044071_02234, partial [Streptococcus pneumoniae]
MLQSQRQPVRLNPHQQVRQPQPQPARQLQRQRVPQL